MRDQLGNPIFKGSWIAWPEVRTFENKVTIFLVHAKVIDQTSDGALFVRDLASKLNAVNPEDCVVTLGKP